MNTKTNFSFELYYAEPSTSTQTQRDQVMHTLEPSLKALFTASDSTATVTVSDSHKGSDNKIVELVTTLQDTRIAEIFKAFCDASGVTVTALE
jgi:hypothetical protein